MNSPNEDPKPVDNVESAKQPPSCCGPECDCHGTGPSGPMRWMLGMIVLLIAATLVARAVVKNHGAPTEQVAAVFPTLAPTFTANSQPPVGPVEAVATPGASVGTRIASLSDLNKIATANDAAFVYLAAQDGTSNDLPVAALKEAASRINMQGHKIALFTLEAGSRDYAQLAAQTSVPAVLALVKGRGMSAVNGVITETKLLQAFVAAGSVSCGPGGCGPAGCCPPAGSK